ncbi:MAG: hypothetical protein M3Y08_05415 [Fibrobacterota bacterium]|nr:hypothetical protein [Fibrobacterota bacterium]
MRMLSALSIAFLALGLGFRPSPAADLQPRSYAYLFTHASLVAVGRVVSVSTGFLSEGRKATVEVEGLIKGKLRKQEIEIIWSDKDHEELAFKTDAKVVVFVKMNKDSTYTQVSPGISCWPIEKIGFKGRLLRAVEYSYPMDLLTGVPEASMRETEEVEKSMNFQVSKRKKWILADRVLPPSKPLVLPKVVKPKPTSPKRVVKAKPAKTKPAKAKPNTKAKITSYHW